MLNRKSTAVWHGSVTEGSGTLDMQSGAFKGQPYSAKMRFGSEDGKAGTNPEELVAAAHAGCFAMALSAGLSTAGHPPDELRVSATVSIDKGASGWSVTGIALTLEAKVPGIDDAALQAAAKAAKEGCPISKALAAVPITLAAKLV